MLSAAQIEDAVMATLRYWFPTYLAEEERQVGMRQNMLPAPQNYINRNSFDVLEGEQLPKVVVISEGLAQAPVKTGAGVYRGLWRLGVGVATGAKDEETSNRMVKAYGAAVRGILCQNQELDSSISVCEITWVDERYDDLPLSNQLMLFKAAAISFLIDVQDIVNRRGGPDTPILVPPPVYNANTVIIEKDLVKLSEEVNP
jgi:hypothetical protein